MLTLDLRQGCAQRHVNRMEYFFVDMQLIRLKFPCKTDCSPAFYGLCSVYCVSVCVQYMCPFLIFIYTVYAHVAACTRCKSEYCILFGIVMQDAQTHWQTSILLCAVMYHANDMLLKKNGLVRCFRAWGWATLSRSVQVSIKKTGGLGVKLDSRLALWLLLTWTDGALLRSAALLPAAARGKSVQMDPKVLNHESWLDYPQ